MSVLELLAAADIYVVSGGDVTIIRTKGSFPLRTERSTMSTENKERRGVLFVGVDKVKWNCDLTMQTLE